MLIRWDGLVLWDALKQRVLGHHAFRPSVGVGMHPDLVYLNVGCARTWEEGKGKAPQDRTWKGLREGVVDPTMRQACGHHHPKTMVCLSGSFGCLAGRGCGYVCGSVSYRWDGDALT